MIELTENQKILSELRRQIKSIWVSVQAEYRENGKHWNAWQEHWYDKNHNEIAMVEGFIVQWIGPNKTKRRTTQVTLPTGKVLKS